MASRGNDFRGVKDQLKDSGCPWVALNLQLVRRNREGKELLKE